MYAVFIKDCFGGISSAAKECITLVEGWCHLHCPSLSCEVVCWYLGKGCSFARGSDASCFAAGK